MRTSNALLALGVVLAAAPALGAQDRLPIYLWLEPEWFDGVQGGFAYWTGTAKPTGQWGVAGPGVSAEWSQGGESQWNSMGACAEESQAACERDLTIPRAGTYRVWVRYVDHRARTEPFTVRVEQGGRPVIQGELGRVPVVPPNDEYMLYWGFSFGWASLEGRLEQGAARIRLLIERAGEAWRQVDALLVTDDLAYEPVGREKPPFAHLASFALHPPDAASWRGTASGLTVGASWKRRRVTGKDFTMWTTVDSDPQWWGQQKPDALSLYDVFFRFSPPADIREKFHQQFAGRKDVALLRWPHLVPGFYLGETPDLSPDSPLRRWLEETRTPFFILTNYATPHYTDQNGPATYQALSGPLAGQFLGYIHGETVGSPGMDVPAKPLGKDRNAHVDALTAELRRQQAALWSQVYKARVSEAFWSKGIPCLSVNNMALAHAFHESGAEIVGYEEDATMSHVPLRIAFERGAARQYGGAWLNYASGNFGDACNYFSQNPVVNRGAGGWFHSKYAVTDGVSIVWYRKLYYLNYLGGASAVFWEQGLANQWILPGPGTHPIMLSPFGRATEEFQAFVDRVGDRGEPYTPIALLVSRGNGYERCSFDCRILHAFPEREADRELRELFDVCWHPIGRLEGEPICADGESLPGGVYGNVFDVLVDRQERGRAILDYPVAWVAGDVELGGRWSPLLREYLRRGGTLVVNVQAARGGLPPDLLGVKLAGGRRTFEEWTPEGGAARACTPYEVELCEMAGARVLAWAAPGVPLVTRHGVGEGAVILTLVPRLLGLDERAHPVLPYLMNGLTAGLLPIELRLASGQRPGGELIYQLNRVGRGWLALLISTRGVDKTQNGIARVDRRAVTDAVLRTRLAVRSAEELTQPRALTVERREGTNEVRLRVHPGDVQVVRLVVP